MSKSDTPRTDALIKTLPDETIDQPIWIIAKAYADMRDFARRLERELAAKDAELAVVNERNADQLRTIRAMCMAIGCETSSEAMSSIEQSRAQVGNLWFLITQTLREKNQDDAATHRCVCNSSLLLEVVRAAEEEYAKHNYKTPTVEKRCGCEFCQAVRGDKVTGT